MSTTTTDIPKLVIDTLDSFGPAVEVTPEATLEALDVDSLDLAEFAQVAEEETGVRLKGEDMKDLKSVQDVIDLLTARASA